MRTVKIGVKILFRSNFEFIFLVESTSKIFLIILTLYMSSFSSRSAVFPMLFIIYLNKITKNTFRFMSCYHKYYASYLVMISVLHTIMLKDRINFNLQNHFSFEIFILNHLIEWFFDCYFSWHANKHSQCITNWRDCASDDDSGQKSWIQNTLLFYQ